MGLREDIECCRKIGRNEADGNMTIGLPEMDWLCATALDALAEVEVLRQERDDARKMARAWYEVHCNDFHDEVAKIDKAIKTGIPWTGDRWPSRIRK